MMRPTRYGEGFNQDAQVNKRLYKGRYGEYEAPKINEWLISIVKGQQRGGRSSDLMSPPPGLEDTLYAMGLMGMDRDDPDNPLVVVELRNTKPRWQPKNYLPTMGEKNIVYKNWKKWMIERLNYLVKEEYIDAGNGWNKYEPQETRTRSGRASKPGTIYGQLIRNTNQKVNSQTSKEKQQKKLNKTRNKTRKK